jgi:hypothetical protein
MNQNGQVVPYTAAGILGPVSNVLPFHTINTGHRYAFGMFTQTSASDARPAFGLWIDGRLVSCGQISAWASGSAGHAFAVGYNAASGKTGEPGYYDDIGISKWTAPLYLDGAAELVERDYYEGAAFPYRTAHYVCSEGSGTAADTFGGVALTLAGGATWIAAGATPKPCDG